MVPTRFSMNEYTDGDFSVLSLSGRIDTVTAQQFGTGLSKVVERPTRVKILDLSELHYISSAGLRWLLLAGRNVGNSARLILCGLSPEVRQLFEVCGLLDSFEICIDLNRARASAILPSS